METISIGIDVAKDKFDVAFLREDHSSSLRSFNNTGTGIGHFLEHIQEQGTGKTVPCVVESTGVYHLPVALMVANAGYRVNCINPLITKKYQVSSVRNAKTDSIDALRLASIGIHEPDLPSFKPDTQAIEARRIASYIGNLESSKEQLKISMKALKQMKGITGLELDLGHVLSAVRSIQKQIDDLTEEVVSRTPSSFLKNKTPGISLGRLAILSSFVSDKSFHSRDALVAFFGLDVMPRQSGNWKGRGRLSKRGNAYARKILFQMAWGLKRYDTSYRDRYAELRKNGKNYKTAMIILARKYLRYFYGQHFTMVDKSL